MKKHVLFVFFLIFFTSVMILPAQTTPVERSVFYGSWELQTDRGLCVFTFVDDIFTFYRDGVMVNSGIYAIGVFPSGVGVQNTNNPHRNLLLMFSGGLELDAQGFVFEISSNSLRLSSDGIRTHQQYFPQGTYNRRSTFVETETGNLLIGVWRLSGTFQDGTTEIFHFFPNGRGQIYGFNPQEPIYLTGTANFDYQFESISGTGEISIIYWDWDTSGFIVAKVIPFELINNNVILLGEHKNEYRRR